MACPCGVSSAQPARMLLTERTSAKRKSLAYTIYAPQLTWRDMSKEYVMSKVAIVYWSGTGNTEAMADLVAQGVSAKGGEPTIVQASDFDASRLKEFDAIAFGCPAMGDEDLEDSEFAPMYDEVEPLLGDKKVALFGSYDWNDGEWMELWEQRAENAGVNVVDSLIAKDYPDEEASAECMRLGSLLA